MIKFLVASLFALVCQNAFADGPPTVEFRPGANGVQEVWGSVAGTVQNLGFVATLKKGIIFNHWDNHAPTESDGAAALGKVTPELMAKILAAVEPPLGGDSRGNGYYGSINPFDSLKYGKYLTRIVLDQDISCLHTSSVNADWDQINPQLVKLGLYCTDVMMTRNWYNFFDARALTHIQGTTSSDVMALANANLQLVNDASIVGQLKTKFKDIADLLNQTGTAVVTDPISLAFQHNVAASLALQNRIAAQPTAKDVETVLDKGTVEFKLWALQEVSKMPPDDCVQAFVQAEKDPDDENFRRPAAMEWMTTMFALPETARIPMIKAQLLDPDQIISAVGATAASMFKDAANFEQVYQFAQVHKTNIDPRAMEKLDKTAASFAPAAGANCAAPLTQSPTPPTSTK